MKNKRRETIIKIINEYNIETQKELTEKLENMGFNVNQSTVSRDIRELKITKVAVDNGKQKYAIMSNGTLESDVSVSDRLIRVFKDGIASIDFSKNIIVIKTLTGMAMAVAAALDAMNNSEILGSIAGDDTIFCVIKDENNVLNIIKELENIIETD